MTLPRALQVDLEITPYYHCISRCVRRAYLCGDDAVTGRSFDHRRGWLVDRIKLIAEVFAVDVCAYAVMSNHFHLVVRVDQQRANGWDDDAVRMRVSKIFRGAFANYDEMPDARRKETAALWRGRLASLSWMMRCLNEWLARRANKEDDCKGRFWEGRFRSQALLDIGAVLACMSYVDLNPVRAGIATRLESSAFTSIQERLRALASAQKQSRSRPTAPPGLAPMMGERVRASHPERLDFSLKDYVELVDWTGRAVHPKKRGRLAGPPLKLLSTNGLDTDGWLRNVGDWGERMGGVVGKSSNLESVAAARGVRWCKGKTGAESLYCAA